MAFDWEKYGVTDARTGGSAADIKHNIDRLYQNVVGRNADPSGSQYWADKIGSGANSYNTLLSGLTSSQEYTDRLDAKTNDPNITEAELDQLDSAYISPFHAGSGSAVAGWKPGDPITEAIANAVTTDPNSPTANYSDQTNFTVGQVNAANNVTDSTGGVGTIGTTTKTGPTAGSTGYLTADDLAAWWEGVDKPWLSDPPSTGTDTGSDDQFMKMMMFMAMMRPQGGGYGGGQYGYGGLNPGGVQSAYNPMANLSSYMDAFRNLPGISTNTISTGTN